MIYIWRNHTTGDHARYCGQVRGSFSLIQSSELISLLSPQLDCFEQEIKPHYKDCI